MKSACLLSLLLVTVLCTSCRNNDQSVPLVVHVWRDPSANFAEKLRQTDLDFALTKPHTPSGRAFIIATVEGSQGYQVVVQRLKEYPPEILIVDSEKEIPSDPTIRERLGVPTLVCGRHPAFIPTSVTGDLRKASDAYLRFVSSNCRG